MSYEPVGYIVEYEICALVFLAVIMARYLGARRFPNQKNRLFALILWCTMSDMTLDIITSVVIDNVFAFPPAFTYMVNGVFYLMQVVMPLLMTVYSLAMTEPVNRRRMLRLFPIFLPAAGLAAIIVSNPLTHWVFCVDPVRGYVRGPLFICTYAVCFFYMGVTFLVTLRNRPLLRKAEFATICRFLAIVLASVLLQFFYPPLLISGVAMALAMTLMYFTLQNPDSMLDAATGAFTYEAMLAFLRDRMQEGDRVRILAVEIRNMRRINELLGVENGRLLLGQVSRFLLTREGEPWVFRMRDDRFVLITDTREHYESARAQLEERLDRPWTVGKTDILAQAAICCAPAGDLLAGPVPPKEIVDYLETALAQAGETEERISTITVGPRLLRTIRRSRAVEAALREAVETGEGLELFYQPLWSVRRERFVGAEALLRFRHPTLGDISPAEFVPIAESNGLVTVLDELALRKACAFIRDERPRERLGLEAVEVNLSALEFMNSRLPELIGEITGEYGVDPGFLFLEITETAASGSFELLLESMRALRRRGCRFALDDFGTGYANISQVIRLPFSMVKLDRSLLLGPETVLEDMARMFARMGLPTVVEGVETARQAELARGIPADYIQGFYCAHPMPQEEFTAFLRSRADAAPLRAGEEAALCP